MELHPNNVEAVDLSCNSLDSMAVSKSESRLFAGASNQHRGSIGLNLPSLLFFFLRHLLYFAFGVSLLRNVPFQRV